METTGLIVVATVLVVGMAAGLWRRRGEGRLVTKVSEERIEPALLTELGVGPAQATLLQFSSAFCAPCREIGRAHV